MIGGVNISKSSAIKLLAVVTATDGYLQMSMGKCHWGILTSPNEELHAIFRYLLYKSFGFDVPTHPARSGRYMVTEVYGKMYAEPMSKLKTLLEGKLEFLSKEPKLFKLLAFRLAMDLEGSVNIKLMVKRKTYKNSNYFQFQFEPEIELSCADAIKTDQWKKTASDIGLKFTVGRSERSPQGVDGIRTSDRVELAKFLSYGGFLTDVKITKSKGRLFSNNGYTKQCILKASLHILKEKGALCSKYFRNAKDANAYRKWFLKTVFLPSREEFDGSGRI